MQTQIAYSDDRGGAPFAAAYAALVSLGEDGFLRITKTEMETAQYIVNEVSKIPELVVIGQPCMTIVSFKVRDGLKLNIFSVSDVMESKGWKMERNAVPQSIHCTLMPQHSAVRFMIYVWFGDRLLIVSHDRLRRSLYPISEKVSRQCKPTPQGARCSSNNFCN